MSKSPTKSALIASGLICLLAPATAAALQWDRLWLNDNQRGAREMEQERYASAAETFDNPRWKAAALYRAGEYQRAAEAWEQTDDTEAHYNRGNALARSGDLQAAIDAYETVLKRNPDHADARHNLELLKRMMKESDRSDSSKRQEQEEQQDRGNENEQASKQQQQRQDQQQQQDQSGEHRNEQENGQSPERSQSGQSEQMNQQQNREQRSEKTSDEKQKQQSGSSGQQEREHQGQLPEPEDSVPETEIPERQAAMEQWLRRIPDDPGGLLRRKFLYQYNTRHRRKERVEQPW